jgi:3-oxoacyl-[acyl-carrier protein] reductase
MLLRNQVALVTGASRGIGRAAALELAHMGAHVVVNYRSQTAAAQEVVGQICAAGGEAFSYAADVSSETEVAAMVEATLTRWGRLDILVNNAGIVDDAPFVRLTRARWSRVIETNLTAAFLCCRAVLPSMRQQRYGRIVIVGSLAGLAGNVGQVNYAAAKAGLVGFGRTLAREVARDGITVNIVAPGYIETEMLDGVPRSLREWALSAIAVGRFGRAEEVAAAIGFLASPAVSYITGQVLTVDGGWVMP